ncbi:hypothetical protein [Streptomyces sp. WMMB303]|uniref:hypothetical protein n=1 Tax=Streptomyces sp. WMMB303 TaxID=3034154 RepID=UPI0023ED6C65|nr:hypothetical protein [Streptomyces sp. WMMB303]MDF4254592.1 hypothetical protein [Streptomyces sp. WMMB303]
MLTCPHPPAITLVMDPHDDVTHTRAALAAHDPAKGRLTIHPTPGTRSALALAHDVLAALGKPVPLTGYRPLDHRPAWMLCAAWTLALPITHVTLLRAHLLDPDALDDLLALRARTGLRLALVCHQRKVPAALERALDRTDYYLADAEALLPAEETATRPETGAPGKPSRRWIALPALTTLRSLDDTDHCTCQPPTADERGFTPPSVPAADRSLIAYRLQAATAHPHLAAQLATACHTAASMPQLLTARVTDAALDARTLTLHDPANARQGCMTHPVPSWARPFLRATVFLHLLTTDSKGVRLFTDPLRAAQLPRLTDVAEQCKLRPPQPPRPKRRKNARRTSPPPTVWPLSTAHHHTL